MRKPALPATPSSPERPPVAARETAPRPAPLSLSRLREAFAAMLGAPGTAEKQPAPDPQNPRQPLTKPPTLTDGCEICPRSVVESILFVGRPDNGPSSARELAAAMRGVSPAEVEAVIRELNSRYDADQAPYHIEQSSGGYRLILRPDFERIRDRFYGRVKEARLSSTALEVLAVLAYSQPATVEQLNELRDAPSGAALATLVRRKLVRLERAADGKQPPRYSTTDRFLELFNLPSLADLPRSEELEKV